ncbi:putative urea hydro-lyase cyanamide [Phaeomoniella chlamydospora]|uniref:Putative urea hydro-lyase cyanamide n=1 Tax=Phaeomoniella chlamydospora TaxID=158046 RepID=A0A0G2HJZ8_PHACM|nr:putative urea hydro-lyase cyanamide [Phaeomoniella chlamydospora]
MRVYHYGLAIAREHFPEWDMTPGDQLEETFFLCAMLHDIATTDEARSATVMSFELHGGCIALDILQHDPDGKSSAPKPQAESVAESIVRHQDIEERGRVSLLTQLIQLATIFDNAGHFAEYVHKDTIEDVNGKFPREKWLNCFADTIKKEMGEKPWSTTTRLGVEEFPAMVLGNELMRPYE